MMQLTGSRHEELLRGMENYNAEVGDVLDWAPSFDLDAYRYRKISHLTGEVTGYGADTVIVTITDPGGSSLPSGFELVVGYGALAVMQYSWLDGADYDAPEYPLGSAVEITWAEDDFPSDILGKVISLRLTE